jgi:hypothetical protein
MNLPIELLESLHIDVRKDIERFIADPKNKHDLFSEKHYKSAICFNELINYPERKNTYLLYNGGLGHGSYLLVFFDLISKDYYVMFDDFDNSKNISIDVPINNWCASKNWNDIVNYLDNFFKN